MLYLSCLTLNPASRQVRAELRDPYQMHRTLARAFPADKAAYAAARVLFRVETKDNLRVLVQSRLAPNWEHLGDGAAYLLESARVKPFDPSFSPDQRLRFFVRANPTKRLPSGEPKKDGPRVELFREEDQLAWLQRKGEHGGFLPQQFNVLAQEKQESAQATRHPGKATHFAVEYDGLLQVTDPALFRQTLEAGIGAGKGFGFGLLSLARG